MLCLYSRIFIGGRGRAGRPFTMRPSSRARCGPDGKYVAYSGEPGGTRTRDPLIKSLRDMRPLLPPVSRNQSLTSQIVHRFPPVSIAVAPLVAPSVILGEQTSPRGCCVPVCSSFLLRSPSIAASCPLQWAARTCSLLTRAKSDRVVPMIQAIGLIVGAYVFLRALDIMCRNKTSFHSEGARAFLFIIAILVILFDAIISFDLVMTGTTLPTPPSGLLR